MVKKHGILFRSGSEWLINQGDGSYMEISKEGTFIEVMDEVSAVGWTVVSVIGEEEALVTMDFEEYKN